MMVAEDARGRRWPEVVNTAAKVFQQKGYRNATVQDVADELGILKGSLYHYIRTKEDLLFAVALDAHDSSLTMIKQLKSLDVDPATELAEFIRLHMGLLMREQIKIGVYLTEFRSLTEDHHEAVAGSRRDYSRYVEDLIRRGQVGEVFSSEVDPAIATLGLLGMLNWTQEWYRDEGTRTRDDITRGFLEIALRGVGANERTVRRLVNGSQEAISDSAPTPDAGSDDVARAEPTMTPQPS